MLKLAPLENAFFYVDTYGLPLEMVMRRTSELGSAVDLSAFMLDAAGAGWSFDKAYAVCNEAVSGLRNEHVHFVFEARPANA